MKNKILIVAFLLMESASAWADDFTIGNLKYTITDAEKHEVSVGTNKNNKPVGDLVIPAEVENEGVKYAVTSIRNFAFAICISLTSVTIPNSVTIIGESAFRYCTGLTTVTIPNSVTSIGDNAFGLVKNIVYSGNAEGRPWGALNVNAIPDENGFIYSDAEKTNLTAYVGVEKEVIIPNTVTSIRNYAFAGCSSLTSIVIGDSVTRIGNWAFSDCRSLTSVTIPESVTSIGENAFHNCIGLTTVTIPNSVNYIDASAFYGCSGLTTMTIPNSVYHIDGRVFYGCSGLTSVTIPESVTSIGNEAFFDCNSLTSVTISNSVASIGEYAFSGCYSLASVTIPDSVTSIGYHAFYLVKNIVYSGNAEGSPWGALTVNGIIDGDFVYSNAEKTKLTAYIGEGGDVVVPETVTSIGTDAFYNCSNITTITIPITVDSIGAYAFSGCTATINCMVEKRPKGWEWNWCGTEYRGPEYQGEIVWKTTTPVTESAANAVNIYANGRNIVVENAAEEISVYDVMGRLVCRDAARHVSTITVNGTGVYIVKVGDVVKRVVIN
ncbi:MAG: leucine-rich repeat domain-containing protein [Salinivirgaceae bacterium]|nr:leucine-rich repeat domain-containing protein [Salinivirgaceae bacterium]